MARIPRTTSASCSAEGLTRAAPRPDRFLVRPLGEVEGVVPSANSGEEVVAGEPSEIVRAHFADVSFIYKPR